MVNKFINFLNSPFYNKINKLDLFFAKIKTHLFYRVFFNKLNSNSIIKNPMLMVNVHQISIGKNVFIRDFVRLEAVNDGSLIIQDGVSIEQRCHITTAGELIIGFNTTILFDIMITDIDHEYEDLNLPISKQPLRISKTYIGENCFIGSGAKIQAGTILGKHCVVGTNAVVRGAFPDYSVIVGIPAKIVKRYDLEKKEWRRTDAKGEFIGE